jgi:hypothetical protein
MADWLIPHFREKSFWGIGELGMENFCYSDLGRSRLKG